ncbi:MAG: hypothetical protein LIP12_09525 [Clostridiales bacterium]|nr:hypothetical protein [Clostridiales bacterium]
MKKNTSLIMLVLATILCITGVSCGRGSKNAKETETEAVTEVMTEAVTETEIETEVTTEAVTEAVTETPETESETETELVTEEATELVTEPVTEAQETESETEAVTEAAASKESHSDGVSYQEAYDYTSEHILEIIGYYWMDHAILVKYYEIYDLGNNINDALAFDDETDHLRLSSVEIRDFNEFSGLIEQYDGSWLDLENESDYPWDDEDSGINVYFKGSDVVEELKSFMSYTVALGSPSDYEAYDACLSAAEASDTCTVVCTYGDYAVVKAHGDIYSIIEQMRTNSGYDLVKEAVDYYNSSFSQSYYPGYQDSMNGRNDALNDYMARWDEALLEWESEFLTDFGVSTECLELEDLAESQDPELGYVPYLLVGKDGSVYSSFLVSQRYNDLESVHVGSDGKWEFFLDERYVALDRDGNILYDEPTSSDFRIFGISPSGNLMVAYTTKDFDHGDYIKYAVMKPDGSMIDVFSSSYSYIYDNSASCVADAEVVYRYCLNTEMTLFSIFDMDEIEIWGLYNTYPDLYWTIQPYFAYSDTWQVSGRNLDDESESFYIDMNTGDRIEVEEETEASEEEEYYFDPFSFPYETEAEETEEKTVGNSAHTSDLVYISPDYAMDPYTFEVYALTDLYTPVGDLSAGQGVERILYVPEEDVFWIASQSGYYYKTDGGFNRLAEPVEIDTHVDEISWPISKNEYDLTPYGVIINNRVDDTATLYNEYGEALLTVPVRYDTENYACSFLTSLDSKYCCNLNTLEMVRVTKPGV